MLVGEFGETVVIDWGLAKDLSEESAERADIAAGPYRLSEHEGLTAMGAVIGTPAYMPPEQARGEQVDQRADVYSLGAMLYHLLCGSAPFSGTSGEVVSKVKVAAPQDVRALSPESPLDLVTIVRKSMSRDPEHRYATAGLLAQDLVRFQTGQLVGGHNYSLGELVRRWVGRHKAVATTVLLASILFALAVGLFLTRERTLRRDAEFSRDRASNESIRADRQTYTLIAQQGVQELASGHPIRAASYFAALALARPEDAINQYNANQSLRALQSVRWRKRVHLERMTATAFSEDGRRIITASVDGSAAIIEASSGAVLARFVNKNALTCAAFSPDGNQAVVATRDGDLYLIDAGSAVTLRVFHDRGLIASCLFSESGRKVADVSLEGFVSIWDVATGSHISLPGSRSTATHVLFSPRGDRLLIDVDTPSFGLYDVVSGRAVLKVPLASGSVTTGAAFCSSEEIATVDHGHLQFWDARTGRLLRTIESEQQLLSVACVHDVTGHFALVTRFDHRAQLWDLDTSTSIVYAEDPDVSWAAFAQDYRYVSTLSAKGEVRLFNTWSAIQLASIDLDGGATFAPILDRTGKWVLVAAFDGMLSLARLPSGDIVNSFGPWGSYIFRLGYADRGNTLLMAHERGVSALDVNSSKLVSLVTTPDFVWRMRLSKDETLMLIATGNEAALYERVSGREIARFKGDEDWIYDCALSPDNRIVATADIKGAVRLWNASTGETLPARTSLAARALAFSPDGTRLALGLSKIKIVDLKTMTSITELEGHPGTTVDTLSFDADGGRLLSAGWDDHLAKVWDVAGAVPPVVLRGHTERLMAAVFSADGKLVATGGFDASARIWNASTGALLRTITGPVHAVQFSPDGSKLATGIDTTLAIWDIHLDGRSLSGVASYIGQHSPWHLVDGELRPDSIEVALSDFGRYVIAHSWRNAALR